MGKIAHVWVNLQDGEGARLCHAFTEPEGGDNKRDVQLPDGRIVKGLEESGPNVPDRRGWWAA